MFKTDIVIIDVETTGTDVLAGHEAIQIAAVRLDGTTLAEKASFESLVRPMTPERAHPMAMQIHKIPMSTLLKAPESAEVIQRAEEALFSPEERMAPGRVGVTVGGHNTQFDMAFLKQMFSRAGVRTDRWGYHSLDLYSFVNFAMATGQWNGPDNPTLDSICEQFGIKRVGQTHDALEDVRLTAEAIRRVVGACRVREPSNARRVGR